MFKYTALVFFTTLNVFAAPAPEFLGTHAFSTNDLKITQTQHLITVAVRNVEAKNFVNALKAQGYQCQLAANSMSKCKKFDRGIVEDADLRADIIREFSKNVLNFELSNHDYEVVNEAPALTELEKSQNSSFGALLFNKIRVYVFVEGLVKLKIFSTSHDEQSYFYLNEKSEISQQISAVKINQKQNLNVVDDRVVYLYEAVWKK
jgi:hypothetical protein